ncbi:thiamine-phosphate kinase [Desulfobulbus propionicus]|jgi:thiamine-monophosphate kinase
MNEREIIALIASLAGPAEGSGLIKGIGDDCAVVDRDGRHVWLLTLDTLIESVHFDCAFHPPEKLGRKAVSVNVSDIGAMGGKPRFALMSVGMPHGFDAAWFRAFAQGVAAACSEYGCLLIGGDTVASPQGLNFSLTLIGEADADKVVYRSGARPGDTLWVSGPLGWAAAGLELLRRGLETEDPSLSPMMEKHLNPMARAELGSRLGESGLVHAMMDLSDGLATDLAHLCAASGVAGQFLAQELPGGHLLARAARLTGNDPLQWAIGGGEDYELLAAASPEAQTDLLNLGRQCGVTLTPIGTVIAGEGVDMLRLLPDGTTATTAVAYRGYDHFRSGGQG